MSSRVIVLTGASSGIGAEAARALAGDGTTLAIVGRDPERTRAIASEVGGEAFLADYDRLDDVRALADALLARYDRIDVLANNAGGIVARRARTADGHERTLQSNHLAPFLLTNLLAPRLIETAQDAPVRVISTSSAANRFGRIRLGDLDNARRPWAAGWPAYSSAKLATVLFAKELGERLTGTGAAAYSFHPGIVSTRFGSSLLPMRMLQAATGGDYGIPAAQGAVPLIALASAVPVGAPSGTYFDILTANGRTASQADDSQLGRDLWAETARLVGYEDPVLSRPTAGRPASTP